MSNFINVEFVQALNPLYAFPIVAVILCAFIVYAFGFKSPVQPPSFDGIEEEKKVTKKRKTKDTSKGKVVQNGKVNGSTSNKSQATLASKKKAEEKAVSDEKTIAEKSPIQKKAVKKSKSSSEKKVHHEKKKESFSQEDAGEDGWVQLISKKGRKSRKKEDAVTNETQVVAKPTKNSEILHSVILKPDETTPPEETPKADVIGNSIPEKKIAVKEEKDVVLSVENHKDEIVIVEDLKTNGIHSEKTSSKENAMKNGKNIDETNTKSKKKKKKIPEVVNSDNDYITNPSESAAKQVISELSAPQSTTNNGSVTTEIPKPINGDLEESQSKEPKSSNVVFDELAGLYPEPKEQRKKKKVRRDH